MIEVNDQAAFPAGLPVLEIIRKLEQERILSRDERRLVGDLLQSGEKRSQLLKCLRDLELGSNSKFAVRRLKAIIHNNGAGSVPPRIVSYFLILFKGLPSSSSPLNSLNNEGEVDEKSSPSSLRSKNTKLVRRDKEDSNRVPTSSEEPLVPMRAISQIFGDDVSVALMSIRHETAVPSIIYAHPENYNATAKILKRLHDLRAAGVQAMKYAVLIGSGSFNPLTRMHLRRYYVAKQYLENSHLGYTILGCLLSPSHATSVRERYKTNSSEVIPSPHRLAIAQMLVEDSSFISVDPWEITRRRPMDYQSLLDHTAEMLKTQFSPVDIKVLYLCKASVLIKLSPQFLRENNYGCVCVSRPPESDSLRNSLGSRWNGVAVIVEDSAVIDAALDVVSSKKVREKLRSGESIQHLVGSRVEEYCAFNKIGLKMNGEEEWGPEERTLPKIVTRHESSDGNMRSSSTIGIGKSLHSTSDQSSCKVALPPIAETKMSPTTGN